MMATQHESPEGHRVILKGAPEVVLSLCDGARRSGEDAALSAAAERMGGRTLRVLAVGVADGAEIDGRAGFSAFRGRVQPLGLLGEMDPPRSEVKEAVERCRDAGIRPGGAGSHGNLYAACHLRVVQCSQLPV